MRPLTKLAAFAAGTAIAFGAAAAVGAAVGPIDTSRDDDGHVEHDDEAPAGSPVTPSVGDAGPGLSGLSVAAAGYRLVPAVDTIDAEHAEHPTEYAFTIEGPDGEAVTEFDVVHERRLHLIVASRDLVEFHHVHPDLAADGTWSIDLPELPAGSYRVYADFRTTGADALTLATDLAVAGDTAVSELPAVASTTTVDGFDVALSGAEAISAGESTLTFEVSRDGDDVVTDPYLGAAGHLVVLRAGDLGYLHVHPLDDVDAPSIGFAAAFPTAGTYRLFLDFSVDGEVHTAAFTVDVGNGGTAPSDGTATTGQVHDDH